MTKILSMIDACKVLRLGLAAGNFPYIVPVNFAYTYEEGKLSFYIHGAKAGRKFELLMNNPYCSFEMDQEICIDYIEEAQDITMRYSSVMGEAKAVYLNEEETEEAMDHILVPRFDRVPHFEYNKEALKRVAMFRLDVTSITAKCNPVRT